MYPWHRLLILQSGNIMETRSRKRTKQSLVNVALGHIKLPMPRIVLLTKGIDPVMLALLLLIFKWNKLWRSLPLLLQLWRSTIMLLSMLLFQQLWQQYLCDAAPVSCCSLLVEAELMYSFFLDTVNSGGAWCLV